MVTGCQHREHAVTLEETEEQEGEKEGEKEEDRESRVGRGRGEAGEVVIEKSKDERILELLRAHR